MGHCGAVISAEDQTETLGTEASCSSVETPAFNQLGPLKVCCKQDVHPGDWGDFLTSDPQLVTLDDTSSTLEPGLQHDQ